MLAVALALALDTADTADTGPWRDTATRAEPVYTQPEFGCGGGAGAAVTALLLFLPLRARGRPTA